MFFLFKFCFINTWFLYPLPPPLSATQKICRCRFLDFVRPWVALSFFCRVSDIYLLLVWMSSGEEPRESPGARTYVHHDPKRNKPTPCLPACHKRLYPVYMCVCLHLFIFLTDDAVARRTKRTHLAVAVRPAQRALGQDRHSWSSTQVRWHIFLFSNQSPRTSWFVFFVRN